MTYMVAKSKKTSTTKLTFSIWVNVPKEAVEAQAKEVSKSTKDGKDGTLDRHSATDAVHKRIPILEFGSSIEPRVGIRIGMGPLTWEGWLGACWWTANLDAPSVFIGGLSQYWIGKDLTRGPYGASKPKTSSGSAGAATFVKDQWSCFFISGMSQ